MNVLVFDIETVPDIKTGRHLYDLDGLSDEDVAKSMYQLRRQQAKGSEFLRHHHHQIVAISVTLRNRDSFKVWSLGDESSDEKEILQRFFDGLERYTPTIVSWNGGGFDLPVIPARALA